MSDDPVLAELLSVVNRWQALLSPTGIGHWTVTSVEIVEAPQGNPRAEAAVDVSGQYDNCRFEFKQEWILSDDTSIADVEQTVIHEWLHVAFRDYVTAVDEAAAGLPTVARELWENRVEHEQEGVIERLAQTIYALHKD